MKFATKPTGHYPSHLRHVATLPREIKFHIFCRCGRKRKHIALLITSNFVIHPQILIFSVFKIASLSPYWLQIRLSMSVFFTRLLLRSICDTQNSSQQTWLQCLSTINMVFSNEDKILIKSLHLKGRQQRGWQRNVLRKAGQSVVLTSCWKVAGYRHSWQAARQRQTAQWKENSHAFVCVIFQIFC